MKRVGGRARTSGTKRSLIGNEEESPQSSNLNKLLRPFFDQEVLQLAKALLGKVLVRKLPDGTILKGTIVETEAYSGGDDKASKSCGGRKTPGNEAMFMIPGTAYVYFTYGMYHCFNISSQGEGSAVLLRAIEPFESYQFMQGQRAKGRKVQTAKELPIHQLANGPGKLCMAFDIRRDNCEKLDLVTSDEMWVEKNEDKKFEDGFTIELGKRVGIDSTPPEARDRLWRFFIKDNFSVSTAKPAQIKKRLELELKRETNK